jgi:hypothetical protein
MLSHSGSPAFTSFLLQALSGQAPPGMERPPHPASCPSHCQEVPHQGNVQLHGRLLRHRLTGEEVLLEDGAVLHFGGAEGRAFVTIGSTATWVNSLFKWSAWKHIAGKFFVFRRLGDGWEAKWQADLEKEAVHGSFPLGTLGAQVQPWPILLFKVVQPDTGCRLFWCFGTCASLANATEPGKLAANWMRYPDTPRAGMLGVTKQHMLTSYRASGTSGDEARTRRNSFFAVSTFFLVLILMSWAVPHRARGDMHEHASQLLASWCAAALPQDFAIQLTVAPGAGMGLQVRQGRVDFADLRRDACYSELTASQKRAARGLPQTSVPIHHALSCLGLKEASSSAWLIAQVARGCAHAAEQKITYDMARLAAATVFCLCRALARSCKNSLHARTSSRGASGQARRRAEQSRSWPETASRLTMPGSR